MNHPTVSILTPTYNHDKFISECIESVLAQTFRDWELIVVDDCSSDRTAEQVKRYAQKDSRIRHIRHETNWGMHRLADGHNEGLATSHGEFVALLEGDDRWAPFKLELQVSAMRARPQAVLCHAEGAWLNGAQTRTIAFPGASRSVRENRPRGSAFKAFLMGSNPIVSQTVMIRRSALESIGGFQPKDGSLFLVDYPTWMSLALLGEFVLVPQVLGYWRQHPGQITAAHNEKLFEDQIVYLQHFLKDHSERLLELDKTLGPLIRDPGYFALSYLFTLKWRAGKKEEARRVHERLKGIHARLPLSLADRASFLKRTLQLHLFSGQGGRKTV